jgi:hypothetical protein
MNIPLRLPEYDVPFGSVIVKLNVGDPGGRGEEAVRWNTKPQSV